MTSRRIFAFFAVLLLVSGCSGAGNLPPMPNAPSSAYTLDSGDKIRLTVFGQQNLSGDYTVADSGTISMPLIGTVKASGSTINQLEQAISARLKDGFLRNPDVSAEVTTFRPFYILGEVEKPGQYPYVNGMTVVTAAAIGGGFTPRAETDYVSITRKIGNKAVEGRAERNTLVMPGDVINVYERYF